MLFGDNTTGRSTSLNTLELLSVLDSATNLEDDFTEGCSHGNFNKTRVVYLTSQSENLCSLGVCSTNAGEPVGTLCQDYRNICPSFYVVDDSRTAPQSADSWEGWLGSRHTTETFDGAQQGCFLTTNEGTSTKTNLDVKVKARTKDVLTQKSQLVGLIHSNLETINSQRILCTDVYKSLVGTNGLTTDNHGFDNRVWVTFDGRTVHVCTRVSLVSITYNVLGLSRSLHSSFPLDTCGESSTTTTT